MLKNLYKNITHFRTKLTIPHKQSLNVRTKWISNKTLKEKMLNSTKYVYDRTKHFVPPENIYKNIILQQMIFEHNYPSNDKTWKKNTFIFEQNHVSLKKTCVKTCSLSSIPKAWQRRVPPSLSLSLLFFTLFFVNQSISKIFSCFVTSFFHNTDKFLL